MTRGELVERVEGAETALGSLRAHVAVTRDQAVDVARTVLVEHNLSRALVALGSASLALQRARHDLER